MTFQDVLAQAMDWLRRDKRITYRALRRQFGLDDAYFEDLKSQLLFSHVVIDEDGQGLVWTGASEMPAEGEGRFQAALAAVTTMLQREGRVTYRKLKHLFSLDDVQLAEIRDELRLSRLAVDEADQVLVWTGETRPNMQPGEAVPSQPSTAATATITPAPLAPQPTRSAPEAERRQLTVMFCDLVGSTDLSGRLDPEDLREVIRAYQETAAEVIERYEGHIAQYLGDGLLIYFGYPLAHEDDAQRAVHTGLGIVNSISLLNQRLEANYGFELAVRIGVHTGPVVVGEMGGGGRHENLALGETPNIAARLESLARPNAVVISPVTAQLVQRSFILEEFGQHKLKGVAELMQVFRVLSPSKMRQDEDESLPDRRVLLMGRDEEVGLLLRCWEQSKAGLGQVVLISGEAGIGKSSLVARIRVQAAQEGYTRITFRCSPYHTNSALYPVIAYLEQMLGFERDDRPETKLDKLEQTLASTNLPLHEATPLMAMLLSVPLEDRRPEPTLPPQQQRQQTLDTLVSWLIEKAERQPTLAVWEDLHWADPSTLEMLGLILEQAPIVSILNVLTYRPEFSPPWPSRSHMTPITLNRLERPQVEALITHLADGKVLPREVVEHIVFKTDGVPLYVEELTKMLLTSELLQEETGQYVLTGVLNVLAIPDTLQDSLMARLDQMRTAKEVAQIGAVLGREFTYELIQAISSQNDASLQASLIQLVDAELLYQRGRPPRARYLFKHALIQDAAYASLLRSQRQQYHQRIANILEAQFPETIESQPELVAHHYTESGLSDQAMDYWRKAGQQAVEHSAYEEATRHLTKALELIPTLAESPERNKRELDILLTMREALDATKGHAPSEMEAVLTRARDLCQQVEESPQLFGVMRALASFHFIRAEVQTALELSDQCLILAQHLQDPIYLYHAHRERGLRLWFHGELIRAKKNYEQAIALHDRYRYDAHIMTRMQPGALCRSRTYIALVLWFLGYPDQALVRMREALALAEELSHSLTLGNTLTWAAMFHLYRRETQEAQNYAEAAIELATEHGFPQWVAEAKVPRGWSLMMQGQEDTGIAQIYEGQAGYQATGSQVLVPHYLGLLAEAYGKQKNTDKGLALLEEALGMADKTEVRKDKPELHRLKGELLLQQSLDNHLEAEACFQQALDISRDQQAKPWELRAAASLARLWQSQNKRQEAYDLLLPVYAWFTEGFDTADLIDAKALLNELEAEG